MVRQNILNLVSVIWSDFVKVIKMKNNQKKKKKKENLFFFLCKKVFSSF